MQKQTGIKEITDASNRKEASKSRDISKCIYVSGSLDFSNGRDTSNSRTPGHHMDARISSPSGSNSSSREIQQGC
jgi:hypothetical protein